MDIQVFYNNDSVYECKVVPEYLGLQFSEQEMGDLSITFAPDFYLLDTEIQFNQLDVKGLNIIVNENELAIDREIIGCCKII